MRKCLKQWPWSRAGRGGLGGLETTSASPARLFLANCTHPPTQNPCRTRFGASTHLQSLHNARSPEPRAVVCKLCTHTWWRHHSHPPLLTGTLGSWPEHSLRPEITTNSSRPCPMDAPEQTLGVGPWSLSPPCPLCLCPLYCVENSSHPLRSPLWLELSLEQRKKEDIESVNTLVFKNLLFLSQILMNYL